MVAKRGNSTILLASVSVALFILASKIRHPLLMILTVVVSVITYLRFRSNYIQYRRKQAKVRRQTGAIDVTVSESRETEDQ